jgi:sugar phosphate isomerase/epimerase
MAALLGASLAAGAADFQKSAIDGWKLSMQAWTYNWLTVVEVLDKAKELGIQYIEEFPGQKVSKDKPEGFGPGMSADATKIVKDKLAETGCSIVAFGVGDIPGDEPGARAMFEWGKSWGMTCFTTETSRSRFAVIDKLSGEYGIAVAIHDHPYPDPWWNPYAVLEAVKGFPNIGCCADTGHWTRSCLVPLKCLKKLKGHLKHFHFKDLGPDDGDRPWGTGGDDARGMLLEAKRQNFQGCFSIEYETGRGDKHLDEEVRACVEWWFKNVAEIAQG